MVHSRGERRPTTRGVGARLAARGGASGLVTGAMVALGPALPHHPEGWRSLDQWLGATPIDAVAIHGAWGLGIGLGAQLTVAHLLAGAGWLARSTRTVRLADRLSAGVVGRAWTGALIGATTTLVPATLAAAQAPAPADQPQVVAVPDAAPDAGATSGAGSSVESAPQLRLLEDTDQPRPTPSAPATADSAQPTRPVEVPTMRLLEPAAGPVLSTGAPPADVAAVAPTLGVWLVRPGDSLWQIAEAVLQRGPGTRGEIDAVHDYWQRLIELNRSNLADPDNPDLLFSGQQLRLPPTP